MSINAIVMMILNLGIFIGLFIVMFLRLIKISKENDKKYK